MADVLAAALDQERTVRMRDAREAARQARDEVERRWAAVRAWLRRELGDGEAPP